MSSDDYDYDLLLIDDIDDDYDGDGGDGECLDTQWITDLENEIIVKDYELFLKTDILRVSFDFIYLARDKQTIEFTIPHYSHVLRTPNQITQSELFQIICRFQKKGKYYNLHSLLLYDFRLPGGGGGGGGCGRESDSRWLSSYLSDDHYERSENVIEYTNLLSIDTIYFTPLVMMFHELIGFTILLYED